MTPCLIVDTTDSWDQAIHRPEGCEQIPVESRPTVLQPDRETADREALRLAKMFPSRRFTVFQAVVMAKCVEVPTHVSANGKVVVSGRQPVLAKVVEDDGIPF